MVAEEEMTFFQEPSLKENGAKTLRILCTPTLFCWPEDKIAVQAQAMHTIKSRGEKIQTLQKHLFPKTFQLLKTIGKEKY